jgi:hypothetical protein
MDLAMMDRTCLIPKYTPSLKVLAAGAVGGRPLVVLVADNFVTYGSFWLWLEALPDWPCVVACEKAAVETVCFNFKNRD